MISSDDVITTCYADRKSVANRATISDGLRKYKKKI